MAATNPGDGSRAYRPYLESRRTTFVSRPSSQGLKPVSRLRGTAPLFSRGEILPGVESPALDEATDTSAGLCSLSRVVEVEVGLKFARNGSPMHPIIGHWRAY